MKPENIFKIIAVLFILSGFFLDPWILEKLLSPQAFIGFQYRMSLRLCEIILVLSGIILLALKINEATIKKSIEYYKLTAITLLTTVLLFISVNALCFVFYAVKDLAFYQNFIFAKYKKPLDNLYPGLTKKEINNLLQETWLRSYVYEPYTQFKERAFTGKYVNVHEKGFRFVKNQGPWPPDSKNTNVFLFGGSTLFNYGLPDDETIASYLQENLQNKNPGKNVFVYNFGQGYYFSSQECILLKKLLTEGFVPNLAVFLDGLNEFYQIKDEPIYTEKLKNFFERKEISLPDLPVIKLINEFKKQGTEECKYNDATIKNIIDRYFINKKIIEVISKSFGVKCCFVWQPIPAYKYDLKYHLFADGGFGRHSNSKSGYEYMEKLIKTDKSGNDFLWLADIQENIKKPLYVDKYHYTSELSKEVAEKISNFLIGF